MRERDCVFSERKGLLPDCSVGKKTESEDDHSRPRSLVRQRNLLARRERRAREQPKARRARLDAERERIHERRAREQPEARQARVNRQRERDHERRAMEQQARQSRNGTT